MRLRPTSETLCRASIRLFAALASNALLARKSGYTSAFFIYVSLKVL